MKDTLNQFNKTNNPILLKLFIKFKNKYNKEYDNFSTDDLVKLVIIFIKDLRRIVKKLKIKKVGKTKQEKKRIKRKRRRIIRSFIPKRDIFYQLKHQYKILKVYLLFESLIKDENEKKLAFQCCGRNIPDKKIIK